MAVEGDYAYVTGVGDGLRVIDVSNSASPAVIGSTTAIGTLRSIAVSGSYAYCSKRRTDFDDHLVVIDIGVPDSPQVVDSVYVTGIVGEITVAGNAAYLRGQVHADLWVVDIEEPESPRFLGGVNVPQDWGGLHVAGDHVYLSGETLRIVPAQCGGVDPVFLSGFDVTREGSSVLIRWALSHNSDLAEFRVIATGRFDEWEVPITELSSRAFHARDELAAPVNETEVTYTLGYREEGHWIRLASRKVFLDACPVAHRLSAPHPNPFQSGVMIRYELTADDQVTLNVFDLSGRLVRELVSAEVQSIGTHTTIWDGRDAHARAMPAGVYFYRLTVGEHTETNQISLIR